MKNVHPKKAIDNERGQPLLVVVLMILALSAASGIWLVSGKFLKNEEAYKLTTDKMIRLGRAIRPDDFGKVEQPRSYSQDAGQIPTTLTALTTNSDSLGACGLDATTRQFTGWCGPYWGTSLSGENGFADGWGTTMVYNTSTCSITSYGPNGVNNSGAGDDVVYKIGAGAYRNFTLGARPVAYWRLGELSGTTATDLSPNSLNGTYAGGYTLGSAGISGDTDRATSFNNSTGYVHIASTSLLNMGGNPFSVSLWVKAASGPTNNQDGFFSKDSYSGGASYTGVLLNTRAGPVWSFTTRNIIAGSGPSTDVYSASAATTNWTHLVGVRETGSPSKLSLYVNGSLETSGTEADYTNVDNASAVTIGVLNASGSSQWFDGIVDEVSLFPYALTSGQVNSQYKIGKCIK